MENARKIGGIAGNESQCALMIKRLETIEELAGDFQVRFHSKTDQHEFIDLLCGANRECCRSDAGNRKIWLTDCSPWRAGALRAWLCGAGLSFPHRQAANGVGAFLKILIIRDCANNLRQFATGLDQVKLSSFARVVRRKRARD